MKASILQRLQRHSPLQALQKVKSGAGGKKEKSLFFSLNLTTLIDAFCILVIFLLSNMNGRVQNLQLNKNMILPAAVQTEALDSGLVIRIENDNFFLEDKQIPKADLSQALISAKSAALTSLIIQADRKSNYENVGLVLRAGGQAGFDKYIFAVLPGT